MSNKTLTLDRSNSSVLNYSKNYAHSQTTEVKLRSAFVQKQQPDQYSLRPFENIPTPRRAGYKLTEAAEGLKELQEKISSALKRSSSATSIRPQSSVYTSPLSSILNQTQSRTPVIYQAITTNETNESFNMSKSRLHIDNSGTPAARQAPLNILTMVEERLPYFGGQTTQASQAPQMPHTSQTPSSSFYFGGLNQNVRNKEELLSSIKNYQVKTVHTGAQDSSIRHYSSHNTTQNMSEKNVIQTLGSSVKLRNFTTQSEFQPAYDKEKLDSVISKIMNSQQSYTPTRQESFVSATKIMDVSTNSGSTATSKIYESRPQNYPQQYYHPRPLQTVVNKAPVQIVYQRPVIEKRRLQKAESTTQKSYCGDIQPDGDSMIFETIDQLHEFEEEVKPVKRGRHVDQENLLVKKASKRQQVIETKKQLRREPHNEPPQMQRKELNYKSNHTSEMIPKGRRHY